MSIDQKLLEMLMCPQTKTDVELATPELLESLNHQVKAGTLKNKSGEAVAEVIDAGLVSKSDPKWLYVIKDGIPVMLPDEVILVSRWDSE